MYLTVKQREFDARKAVKGIGIPYDETILGKSFITRGVRLRWT
ncbi:hypothetical protein SAMN05421754_10261, partial [Nitrosomonas sp. Nm58]